MEEFKRYNEVKSIGEIMKEWGMDAENISHTYYLRLSIEKQQKDISNALQRHINISDRFEEIYEETTNFILDFENFFTCEKKIWKKTQDSIRAWNVSSKDLQKHIQRIESLLEEYEEDQQQYIKDTRSLINFIDTKQNKQIYYDMINKIAYIFVLIRIDILEISDLYHTQIDLLKKRNK